jgi:hypothetical protein
LEIAPPPQPTTSLGTPVGALMRVAARLGVEDSLDRAAQELRRSGNSLVPITDEERLVGIVTQRSIGVALANGCDPSDSLAEALVEPEVVRPYESAASALRALMDSRGDTLVVTDDHGHLMGVVSPSDLYPRRFVPPRPPMVGGMATPFGVYLTTGAISGGAGGWALVATGALLFFMLAMANFAVIPLTLFLDARGVPEWVTVAVGGAMPIAIFMLLMRLVPLAGTHAAEHQVVHALERGEELRPEVVRRMPRVHPRCGTNLAVGAMLFLGIFSSEWVVSTEVRFMVAALTALMFWRRLGSVVQLWITTRPPSEKQVRNGIRAAEQLLHNYAHSRNIAVSPFHRIWRSGILHVVAGSMLCYAIIAPLAKFIAAQFGIDLQL